MAAGFGQHQHLRAGPTAIRSRQSVGRGRGRRDQRCESPASTRAVLRRASSRVRDDAQRLVVRPRCCLPGARLSSGSSTTSRAGRDHESRRGRAAARAPTPASCGPETQRAESPEEAAMRPSSDGRVLDDHEGGGPCAAGAGSPPARAATSRRAVADLDGDTGGLEGAATRPAHVRVRVADRVSGRRPRPASISGRGAGRGAAGGAPQGFERDEDRGAARPIAGFAQTRRPRRGRRPAAACGPRRRTSPSRTTTEPNGGVGRAPAEGAAALLEGELHLFGESPPPRLAFALERLRGDGTAPARRSRTGQSASRSRRRCGR